MEIRAFRGWRYKVTQGRDAGQYLAPPYDVLSAQDKQRLLARSEHNIVAVDLPHVPPKEVGPDSAYKASADLLAQWKQAGVLRLDERPCVYAYQQMFAWAGRNYTRRAIIAAVRGSELGKDVIPHEHTFAGPKADRLKLTQFTRMQLSPIFGFYRDGGCAVGAAWAALGACTPMAGRVGDIEEALWPIDDPAVIRSIAESLARAPVFIADGHHRYTTAMNYRDSLGKLPPDHPANFVMFALVERDDPGMVILPTHRMVRGLRDDFAVSKLAESAKAFAWQRRPIGECDFANVDGYLKRCGPTSMLLMGARPSEIWIATLRDKSAMDAAAPDQAKPWRELDVAILHKLIIDGALAPWRTVDTAVDYTADAGGALAACRGGQCQFGVCLQGTPLDAVEQIALAGAFMPHKSTYFYPKLSTGAVLMPLE